MHQESASPRVRQSALSRGESVLAKPPLQFPFAPMTTRTGRHDRPVFQLSRSESRDNLPLALAENVPTAVPVGASRVAPRPGLTIPHRRRICGGEAAGKIRAG